MTTRAQGHGIDWGHSSSLRRVLGAAMATVIALGGLSAPAEAGGPVLPCDVGAADRTWDGEGVTDDWDTAANWSGDAVPIATDDVCIPAGFGTTIVDTSTTVNAVESRSSLSIQNGTLTITGSSEVDATGTFTVSGSGALDGVGGMAVHGPFNWVGGPAHLLGSGDLTLNGVSTFSGTDKYLGKQINNNGTITWSAGAIRTVNGASFVNGPLGVFDITEDVSIIQDSGGVGFFVNNGLLKLTGFDNVPDTMTFDLALSNGETGVIRLRYNGKWDNLSVEAADMDGTLEIDDVGFTPFSPGAVFAVITNPDFPGLRTGTFDSIVSLGGLGDFTYVPQYLTSGLQLLVKYERTFTALDASQKNVVFGKNFKITGGLGSVAAECTDEIQVTLYREQVDGGGAPGDVATKSTNPDGEFSFTRTADENSRYWVETTGADVNCAPAQSAKKTVNVRKKVTVTPSKNPVAKREPFKLTVQLAPCAGHEGDNVILYKVSEDGGRVDEISRKDSNDTCKAVFNFANGIPSTKSYLAKSPAAAGHLDHITGFGKVKVRVADG
jgi:hypothetical protein